MDEDVRGDRSSKLPFNTQELRATLFSLTNPMAVHIQVTDAPDSQTPLTLGHPLYKDTTKNGCDTWPSSETPTLRGCWTPPMVLNPAESLQKL